jgi:hypothetical protein
MTVYKVLVALALVCLPALAEAQAVVLISPTSAQVTTNEPPAIVSFHLTLQLVGDAPTAVPVAQADLLASATRVSPGVYSLPLAALLSNVSPPQRALPLMLWVTGVNATSATAPMVATQPLIVNAPPPVLVLNPLISVILVQ